MRHSGAALDTRYLESVATGNLGELLRRALNDAEALLAIHALGESERGAQSETRSSEAGA